MRATGKDIASSFGSIGVTLSGGLDSRAVLSVLPKDQVTAITYVTHMNYETDVAKLVAKKYDCDHVFATRSDDYFLRVLLDVGPDLMGIERRAMLHGLCIPESNLHNKFDIILGGQLSDTYLKNHYMPKWQREHFRPKGPRERLGIVLRSILGFPPPVHLPGIGSNLGRYRLEKYLAEHIRDAVQQRRTARLHDVRQIRPQTAEEWVNFWPTSRQDDLSHIVGNSKLFAFETMFSHKYILDLATKLLPIDRYGGRVASEAFAILYGDLGDVCDANTGARPGAEKAARSQAQKRGPDQSARPEVWNNVANSWFDLAALQRFAPRWQKKRQELSGSPALAILDKIVDKPADYLLGEYCDELGPTFNQMYFQLIMVMDKKLR
jgi:hypothetical protein